LPSLTSSSSAEIVVSIGVSVSGAEGPVDLVGSLGFNHVVNDQNQPGVTANRVVARIFLAFKWRRQGSFRASDTP